MFDMNSPNIHNHVGVHPVPSLNENSSDGSYHQHQDPIPVTDVSNIEGDSNSVEMDDGSGDTAVTNVYINHDGRDYHNHQHHHP